MTYRDVVKILEISQNQPADGPARSNRFEAFKRAVSFYGAEHPLKIPSNGRGVILVGGTNGKGTVAKTLETLLGADVGLFTSPHLMEPTERIRTQGRDLSEEEMVLVFERVEPTVQRFDLSHFEILTLMMIEVFFGGRVRPRVSWAVIEVGVGGRLDPTRVVPHETAVLARIGLDHEAILGATLPLIAREKLVIADGARRLIHMRQDSALESVFAEARLQFPSCEFIEARSFESEIVLSAPTAGIAKPSWRIQTPWGSGALALMGERAVQNTSLALEVLDRIGVEVAPRLTALGRVRWPGRMESLSFRGREIYLSGDHNEQGVQSLVDLLSHFPYEKLWLVIGVGKGKPIAAMLARFQEIPRAHLILTRTSFRAVEMSVIESFSHATFAVVADAFGALELACEKAGPRDLVVVSGSLYLVGDLRRALFQES